MVILGVVVLGMWEKKGTGLMPLISGKGARAALLIRLSKVTAAWRAISLASFPIHSIIFIAAALLLRSQTYQREIALQIAARLQGRAKGQLVCELYTSPPSPASQTAHFLTHVEV